MSAFRRRTVFAAPLIISLVGGCSKKEPERTNNPPPPEVQLPPPKPSAFEVEWDVRRVDAGACEADFVVECPPNTKCNPPAPLAVECPAGTSGRTVIRVAQVTPDRCGIVPKGCVDTSCVKLATPCPLPAGQKLPAKLVEVWTVEKNKNGDGGCHAEEPEADCPPNADCNPPVPRKIECPPGVTETVELKVGLLPDKTCAILPDDCTAPGCAGAKTPCPS
ncbi:MAG: hypothetical protein H0V17_25470 [Deltaproteobacteria bacterium]|nr:hypothetical protein [Deltaproteobacteria bacterium]